jgi:Holliday junction DNA helicase RuvA
MIGSLRGAVLERSAGELLLEVGGVGYRVTVSPATAAATTPGDDDVFLHVHHHVREDAQVLYGFLARDERACFEALLGAHGVGPSLALAILSVHTPDALRRALVDDDLAALCLVPGVGRKTAARLLVELKSRLAVPEVDLTAAAVAGNGNASGNGGTAVGQSARVDVRDALTNLGYGPDEVREALLELPDDGDPSLLLKQALRHLGMARR